MNRDKDYVHFEVNDFLHDSCFLAWRRDENPKINAFWDQWQKEHPEMEAVICEAKRQYDALISFEPIRSVSEETQEEVWRNIEFGIQKHVKGGQARILRIRIFEFAAAAVALLVLAGAWFMSQQKPVDKDRFIVIHSGDTQRKMALADGSTILLNANTTLKYSLRNDREFWINGQAFFDIKHRSDPGNAAVPFKVHAGIENIIVLGTAFTVKSIDSAARIVLMNGKVRAAVGNQSVVIKPGEKMEWHNKGFSSEKVDVQLYLSWKDGEFNFNHTSLKQLSGLIRDYYGYELVIKNKDALKTRTISGTVTSKDESILWKTLGVMFNAEVRKEGEKIILTINN